MSSVQVKAYLSEAGSLFVDEIEADKDTMEAALSLPKSLQMKTEDVLFGFVLWLVVHKKMTLDASTNCDTILKLADEFCLSNHARADWGGMPLYDYNKEKKTS